MVSELDKKIIELYNNEKKSTTEIAKMLGIKSHSTILRHLKKNRIERRYGIQKGIPRTQEFKDKLKEISRNNKDYGMRGKHQSEETKRKMSIAKKGKPLSEEHRKNISSSHKGKKYKPMSEIGRKNISDSKKGRKNLKHSLFMKLNNPMKREDMKENMSKRISGSGNYFWEGGISKEKYGLNFNNRFKNLLRKRDNQICMGCGIHREKLNEALHIHHIDYNKLNNIKENCISLCRKCHIVTNFNRQHWVKFFQSLLSERYNYQYSELNEPIINIEVKND